MNESKAEREMLAKELAKIIKNLSRDDLQLLYVAALELKK